MTLPQNTALTGDRDHAGRFRKGVSGNPGGRPKNLANVTAMARELTEDAVATLAAIMMDADMPPAARVRAAEALLDRGWGAPIRSSEPVPAEPIQIRLTYADREL